MVYKDEAKGSHTYVSQSRDLENWTNAHQAGPDGGQEAPFVFRWKGKWWLIVDDGNGLRIYNSENGIDGFKYSTTILASRDGTRRTTMASAVIPGSWFRARRTTSNAWSTTSPNSTGMPTSRSASGTGRRWQAVLQSQQVSPRGGDGREVIEDR